ncbi:apolipoprotein L domain-containing protein 1 isoform X2 [Lynx rufus]|uniref:apolipoprotein L domain-containing protein 1 isoform X2 n=1 Tax=Lynx rufus TaxID=61384 RepID=UPI001F125D33|nr:apolipoprotein L domain-containing protein 1 isoform X2 [Lynx rufus]
MDVWGTPFRRLLARGAREALTEAQEKMHLPLPWKGGGRNRGAKEHRASRSWKRQGKGASPRGSRRECSTVNTFIATRETQGKSGWTKFAFMRLKNHSLYLSSRLLETGYGNGMEKSSPGDGFLPPEECHRKRRWKKPRQHRNKNAYWLLWELCHWTEFTFSATLQCRQLKFKRDSGIKRFLISGWERTAPQIRSDPRRCCQCCTILTWQGGSSPSNALPEVELPGCEKCKVPLCGN